MTDTKEWLDAVVTSDGNTLDLYKAPVCRSFSVYVDIKVKLVRSIPKERILTYTQRFQGTGNNGAAAAPSVAASAFIMSILVPFQAMASSRSTKVFE